MGNSINKDVQFKIHQLYLDRGPGDLLPSSLARDPMAILVEEEQKIYSHASQDTFLQSLGDPVHK